MLIKVFLGMIACFCLLSCDLPATGGNPGEGRPCNEKVLKVHDAALALDITANCAYEKECDVKLYFYGTELPDSLKGMCFGGGTELRLESFDTSMVVKDWKIYPVSLSQDDHLRFSLFDINNIEKKYDIDFSEIIHSYTVRGDSVEVKSFDCLERMVIYKYRIEKNNGPHDIIDLYPDSLKNGKYVFYQDDLYFDKIYFNCSLNSQSSFKTDSIYIHGDVYWR